MKEVVSEFNCAKLYYLEKPGSPSLVVVLSPDLKVKRKKIIHTQGFVYCSDRTFDETIHDLCVNNGYMIRDALYFPFIYGVYDKMWFPKNTVQKIVPRKYPLKYIMTKNDNSIECLYNVDKISLHKYENKNIIIIGDYHTGHFKTPPRKRGVMKIDHFCRNLIDLYDDISFICEGTRRTSGYHDEQESMLSLFNTAAMSFRVDQSILLVKNITFPYVDIRMDTNENGGFYMEYRNESEKLKKKSFRFLDATKNLPYHPFRSEAIKLIKSRELTNDSHIQCANVDAFILLAIAYSKNKNIVVHAGYVHTDNVVRILDKYTKSKMSLVAKNISKDEKQKNFPWRTKDDDSEHFIRINQEQSTLLTSFFK